MDKDIKLLSELSNVKHEKIDMTKLLDDLLSMEKEEPHEPGTKMDIITVDIKNTDNKVTDNNINNIDNNAEKAYLNLFCRYSFKEINKRNNVSMDSMDDEVHFVTTEDIQISRENSCTSNYNKNLLLQDIQLPLPGYATSNKRSGYQFRDDMLFQDCDNFDDEGKIRRMSF